MTGPSPPENLQELIAGYVLGNLGPEEAEAFKRLLTQHPELAPEVTRLREVLELMPYALPETPPPQSLRSTLLSSAQSFTGRAPQPSYALQPRRLPLPWQKLAGSAAALLLLTLGVDRYRLQQELRGMQAQIAKQKDVIAMLQAPKTQLVSLKGMEMAPAASGSIVITPGEPKVVLAVRNLPPPPAGQSYQLWAVINGESVACGPFQVGRPGTALAKLSIPAGSRLTELVVTVEGSATPARPAGPRVMTSSL